MDQAEVGQARVPSSRHQIERRLLEITERVKAHTAGDPHFVAVATDTPRRAVEVWRTGDQSDEDIMAVYRDLVPPDVGLRFRRAVLSNAQKAALDELVGSKESELRSRGLLLVAWGNLDGREQPYVVGYEGPPAAPDDVVAAFQLFGEGTVVVRREERPDGGVGVFKVGTV